MFVRVARFEGGDSAAIEAEWVAARDDIAAIRRGEEPKSVPPELVAVVSRVTMLHDRASGSSAMLLFCETAEDVATADRILGGMNPQHPQMGTRVAANIYEVGVDEVLR